MKRPLLAVLVLAALAAVIYFAAFAGRPADGARRDEGAQAPQQYQPSGSEPAIATASNPNNRTGRSAIGDPSRVETTVALWLSDGEPEKPGSRTPSPGAGRTSLLSGVVSVDGLPVANAQIRCIAGLNEGASCTSDAEGAYALSGLYPGLTIVEFAPPSMSRAVREVVLRRGAGETLDLDCAGIGNVHGTICGFDGKPIIGASVELDGLVCETDKVGAFFFSGVIPGNCILYITAPGFERRREVVSLRPHQALEFDANRFLLRAGEPLTASFDLVAPSGNPLRVALLPGDVPRPRNFPFEKVGLLALRPGDATLKIDGIPTGESFEVRGFSDSGVGSPGMRPVLLKRGDTNLSKANFSFAWKTPYSGKVVSEGRPVAGARVRVESCDIARAMDDLLRDGGGIQAAAVPILPPARREVRASSDGMFRVEGGDVLLPGSLVIEADGFERRSMPLKGIATDYGEIALTPRGRGPAGSVTLDFQRPALRDVRVFVNGKPIPKKTLQSGERLVIPGVEPGIYGIRVQETSEEDSFPVFERAAIALPLAQPLVVPLR